jgi:hypothetical protein
MRTTRGAAALASVSAFVSTGFTSEALAGPDWVEQGDAGSFLFSAQNIGLFSGISTITGTLGADGRGAFDFEDCYRVIISDPNNFSFSTSIPNLRLYVFRISDYKGFDEALGVLANDNGPANASMQSFATDFTESEITTPGEYLLAMSFETRQPVGFGGQPIFNIQSPTEVSGPDGSGGEDPLSNWTGFGTGTINYEISVDGVFGTRVPAPTAAGVLLLGALGALRRRR